MTNKKKSAVSCHAYDLVLPNEDNKEKNTKEENVKIVAPDGGYGWVVLFASFMISVILDGIMYSFSMIKNGMKNYYEESEDKTNLIISFNTGFLFCSGPIVAGLANQFGCRIVVMMGALVTSLMYFLSAFAPSIEVIIVTYGIVGGLSTGCTYIASLIVVNEYFEKKKGIATGITMAGSGFGQLVLAPPLQYLTESFDWKIAISICSCIILQACVCGALLRPLNPNEPSATKYVKAKSLKNKNDYGREAVAKTAKTDIRSELSLYEAYETNEKLPLFQRNKFLRMAIGILKEMTDFKLLCENVPFLLITLSNFFISSGYLITFMYMTIIADKKNIKNSSWLLSIIGGVNIPFRIIFGLIADTRYITPVNLNTIAVFISTVSLFFYPLLQSDFLSQALFASVFAVGAAGINSLMTKYLVDIAGVEKFNNSNGIINLFKGFGCFICPFLGGLIVEKYDETASFYYSGVCFLIGLIFSVSVSVIMFFKKDANISAEESNQTHTSIESEFEKNLIENKV